MDGRIVDFLIERRENGYAKFIFKSDYSRDCPRFNAVCEGNIPDVVPGVPLKVEFREDCISNIKKYDKQSVNVNQIAYACVNYNDENYAQTLLMKVKGISSKTANKILEAVGGDISRLSELWDDKKFWKALKGSKRYFEELQSSLGSMLEKDNIVKKYQKYGIGYPQAEALTAEYGLEAEEKLCQNPYAALYKLGLNFQVADNLAKDLKFHYLDTARIRAIIRSVLSDNETNGNTAINRWEFFIRCAKMHEFSAWKEYVVSPYLILAELPRMIDVYCESGLIGYTRTLNLEADIAYQLLRLMKSESKLYTPNSVFDEINTKYNKEQLEFLKEFDKNSVTILLGRGGTGKTHTICGAIDLFKRRYPNEKIKLCAPTARAAGVLKEHSGYESSTIHIMLELSPYKTEQAGKNEENPIDAKLIVVDEMSMVDTELMYHLLRAVKSGTKLILSGDPDQLESVGCGSVLKDLIDSDSVPKVKLRQIMRQSEDSAIIENCGRILNGKSSFLENQKFLIRKCRTEEEASKYLQAAYSGDAHHTQILSTTKKGLLGTEVLNAVFEDKKQKGVYFHGSYFKKNDKVIFTKNNYDKNYCNGDIGFIESIDNHVKVKMQDTGKIIEIDKEIALDMEHADVITIHKSQGSEYKQIYIMLPEAPVSLLTRNMVNTAVSRAREQVVLIIVGKALRIAASNKYKTIRVTRLKEKLKNMGEEKCLERKKIH